MARHTGAAASRLRPVTGLSNSFAVMATKGCPSVTEDAGLPRSAHPPALIPAVEMSERMFLLVQREAFAPASGSGPAYITGDKERFAAGY